MGTLIGLTFGIGLLLMAESWNPRPSRPQRAVRRHPLESLLLRAGMPDVAPRTVVAAVAAAAVAGTAAGAVTSVPVMALLAGAAAAWTPFAVVRSRAARRQREHAEAWPDAVDHLASAVRAGLSLPEALIQLGQRGPEPLRDPFTQFGRDYGSSGRFAESLDRLKARLADPVGDRVVEALRIAREVLGGDLGRLLRSLSGFLRDDLRTRGEIESRQSWTIGAARLTRSIGESLGSNAAITRRLRRCASDDDVEDFRVRQATWGAIGLAIAVAVSLLAWSAAHPPVVALLLWCGAGLVGGCLACDQALSSQVRRHETRMRAEFPTIADLLALSVAAGESPVAAIERVSRVSHGALSLELGRVLADVRAGATVVDALDVLAARTGVLSVARFAEALAVAIDRGTPLIDVLHAQAADVRETARRELIESGGRREIAMMVPVVFLILPVTIAYTLCQFGSIDGHRKASFKE
ncbi:type II secretion system F family protein [Aeromicrobium tamlense]|uniref:Flp pilus assembly protein TadB n=1 Tax=Aeromicrobium tamlense TaxID=375541 RepID=A0A8I0FXW8_9ACTN|nr:type II secretion system F family protein [Aeromicrobium tamlense]MBD1271723.1 type II secretion system F family protein [Aeromicrobium tamlense]NYI37529.1 Flp pilus assembly protein TadB [Aeromicrobium tamlense]